MRLQAVVWLLGFASLLSGCVSTRMGEKGAYVEADKKYEPVRAISGLRFITLARAGDEALYQQICSNIQSVLLAKGIPSDMKFLKESAGEAMFETARSTTNFPFILRIDPIISTTYQDEWNNPYYVNQVLFTLMKSSGNKLADIVIRIDKDGKVSTQSKEIAQAITRYLSKKGWIN